MAAVEVTNVSYSYGKIDALHTLDLAVPDGAIYALLGPNGSGKSTLLQLLMGMRRTSRGRVSLFGVDSERLTMTHRQRISYVAEGQPLPAWMTLSYLERYLAPLYPSWDPALANDLRERFGLDPHRRVGALSRGERMKASLLCALAPRPKLLLMDEPFTGMDAVVKDDLVRGLLASAGNEGWTVVIASHDIAELELLADWVGLIEGGRMQLSEPMEQLRERFKRVTVVADESQLAERRPDDRWLAAERAGRRLSFIVPDASEAYEATVLPARFPGATRIDVQDVPLRDIFVALTRARSQSTNVEVAA